MIRFKKLVTVLCLPLLAACMPNIENEDAVESPSVTSHEILKYSGMNAKIMIYGTCPAGTKELRVAVGESDFSVNSSSGLVTASGVPVGECNSSNQLTITYPVPDPETPRSIEFKIKAKMLDGRVSLLSARIRVNYSMPTPGVPGYAVTSGGGQATGAGVMLHGSAGEPAQGIELSGSDAKLRHGLHGVIFDESL